MSETIIRCPHCLRDFELTESLAAPLLDATRREYDEKLSRQEAAIRERELAVSKQQDALDEQVAAKIKSERARIAAEEAKTARLALSHEIDQRDKQVTDLQRILKARDEKLAEAQKAQADLLRKQRELDDAKREMELTIEKRVQKTVEGVREKARVEAEESSKLKVAEKEQTILALQRQIDDLKRRAEQGSQQLQGEVQELELESMLRAKFPTDSIEPVPKGAFGGDVLQRVVGPQGQACGAILWESKRTKNWSDKWLSKLRGDQRAAKADVAMMVSQALPDGVESFDYIDGVWVTGYRHAIPVAIALRQSLVEIAGARLAGEGQQTKMSLVYKYLTGPRFRQRVEVIVEKFGEMHDDLERERKAMTRLWAKREEQIRGVIEATAGMYGDLQGIAGKTLQEIDGLEHKYLTAGGR